MLELKNGKDCDKAGKGATTQQRNNFHLSSFITPHFSFFFLVSSHEKGVTSFPSSYEKVWQLVYIQHCSLTQSTVCLSNR